MNRRFVCVAMSLMALTLASLAEPAASNLAAEYRDGQVFLTWKEAPEPEGTTFSVYLSDRPITDATLGTAQRVCAHINPRSARDWWLDPSIYVADGSQPKPDPKTGVVPVDPRIGFVIREGGKPLDADGGLHVHTVAPGEEGPRYYAVTCVKGKTEDRTIVPGQNALTAPVHQTRAPLRPIWLGEPGKAPAAAPAGRPVLMYLHGKGRSPAKDYLVFGDGSHGWREGLAFKFELEVTHDLITVNPKDSMWLGRPFAEGNDGMTKNKPVIFTFWYGCSDKIYDPALIPTGTPTAYSEQRLLWILSWVREHFQADSNRVYSTGSSMGGCGGVQFALRHPEVFAAIYAGVPIVAYNEGDPKRNWPDNTWRMIPATGPFDLKTSDGMTLRERVDAARFVRTHWGDLPFLVTCGGRNDASIPWHNNPNFYRALQEGRHGALVAWNDGTHGEVEVKTPPDFNRWGEFRGLSRFAINKSYPAFSRCSMDADPGNGDATNGVVVGFMNRGLDWEDPKDEPKRYEILIRWTLDPAALPVTVDVTPRRVQAFRLAPRESCSAANLDADGKEIQRFRLGTDEHGLLTCAGFRITSAKGNRLVLSR